MDSRLGTALRFYAFALLGVCLLLAPWSRLWGQATAVLLPPPVDAWARTGWVRGLVSGVGALDLAVALQTGLDLWRDLGGTAAARRPGGAEKK